MKGSRMPKSKNKSTASKDSAPIESFDNYLTIAEAAPLIKNERGERGVTRQRVLAIIKRGRLPAQKRGRDWFIKRSDALAYEPLPPHRPEKQDDAE